MVAELLKDGGDVVCNAIAVIFNDILMQDRKPPDEWRESRITVLFKKGDRQRPDNYRPITLLLV